MPKMRLSSITIQGMHHVTRKTYNLGDFNYLNGLNGSGKTTVMQAIQLALLGYIPGTDKRKDAIFKHAGQHEMKVILDIDNQGEIIQITRGWSRTSKDLIASVSVKPDIYDIEGIMQGLELPICNFDEFVGMTSNKLKDWFMWFLPASNDAINWDAEIDDTIKDYGKILDIDYVEQVKEYASKLPPGLEGIRNLNDWLKSEQSARKVEAARIQNTIQSLVFYDDCEEGLDATKLKDAIVSMNQKRDDLMKLKILINQNEQTMAQINNLSLTSNSLVSDPDYIDMMDKLKKLSDERQSEPDTSELSKELTDLDKSRVEMLDKLNVSLVEEMDALNSIKIKKIGEISSKKAIISERQKVLDGEGICPYTAGKCDEISKLVNQYTKEVKTLNSELTVLNTELASIESQIKSTSDTNIANAKTIKDNFNEQIIAKQNEITKIQADFKRDTQNHEKVVGKLTQDIHNLETKYAQRDSLMSRIAENLGDNTAESVSNELSDLDIRIENQQLLINKVESNKRYNELIDVITKQKYQIEQSLEMLKDWIKLTDVNGLQSKVMDTPFENLATSMTSVLKRLFSDVGIKAKFNLSTKVNSFSFGIVRDDTYIPFDQLSGGEKCLYTLSLLISIVSADDIQLPLVLVDDLIDHLDRQRVDALFDTLSTLKGPQIILAGVQECNHPNKNQFVLNVVK